MGRGGFKRKGGGGRKRDGGGGGGRTDRHQPYSELVKENEKLQTYYNGLLGLKDNEAEREAFWAAFRRELPHSFRFCGSKGHAQAVQKLLQTRYIPEIARMTQYDGHPVTPPEPVPWYPNNLAWWMTTSKTVIRKSPPFAAFQKFLVSETSVGNISRQEVVSMIPPLLMDVRPGMAVLDLCAAPGSKAAQLLEMVHQGEEARVRKVMQSILSGEAVKDEDSLVNDNGDDDEDPTTRLSADPSDDGRATGILVANDADYKRSHLLIHQLKRLSSPNIIVTNHDATIYPSLRLPPLQPSGDGASAATKKKEPVRYLKFDRILADVPCSGDGTLRKNVNMWKEWNPGNALGLHLVQVRILVRALQMLKPGGRVVYSTCSLNPVENESVVAAAIAQCGGPAKVDILDSSDKLPELKRVPGLTSWQIMDKAGRLWSSWDEVEAFAAESEDGVPPSRVVASMFSNAESAKLPLDRCLRVYPHLQDTGGFFIVVLEKKAEFKAKTVPAAASATSKPKATAEEVAEKVDEATNGAAKRSAADDAAESEESQPVKKQKQESPVSAEEVAEEVAKETALAVAAEEVPEPPAGTGIDPGPRPKNTGPYEEPFKYLSPDHDVVKDIQQFYHLSPRFPTDRFMVRNAFGEPAKAIYYTSSLVRDILVSNSSGDGPQQGGSGRGVKFVHGGVRMFVKQDAPAPDVCRWRIQAEGLPLLSGYVGAERIVKLHKKATLKALLLEMFPKFTGDEWKKLGEVGEQLPNLGMGCYVVKVEPRPEDADEEAKIGDVPLEAIALPLWKSFHSLNLMLPKEDRAAMLLRIFNDRTPLVNNSLKDKAEMDKAKEAAESAAAAAEPAEEKQTGEKPAGGDVAMTDVADNEVKTEAETVNDYDAEDAPSS